MSKERAALAITGADVRMVACKVGAGVMVVLRFLGRVLRGALRVAVPVCGFVFILMLKCISAMAPRR